MGVDMEVCGLRDGGLYLRLTGVRPAGPEDDVLPAFYFDICLDGVGAIGRCDLRLGENARTRLDGNAGYLIHRPWRGHRYAARALGLLLALARRRGMARLIVTCDPENAASARTCERAGGVAVGTVPLPPDHGLYATGQRAVRVYEFIL